MELEIAGGFIGQIAEPRAAKLAPRTPTHARASVFYAVAAALAQGNLGMDEYSDAAITRPDILELAARVRHRVAAPADRPIRFGGAMRVICTDGRVFSLVIDEADGTGARGLSAARIEDKFRACTPGALSAPRIEVALALCREIETLSSIDVLLEAMT